jgi:hypothetical protein
VTSLLSWPVQQQVRRSWELQQIPVLNEVLDNENIGEYSLNDDSTSDNDCKQLVNPRD